MIPIIVCNWKMYLSFKEAYDWIMRYGDELKTLGKHNTLVLCPSYESLNMMANFAKESSIKLGAQDCAAHLSGAYTGQVSALSLAQLGCSYCIIGHSEQRYYYKLSSQEIAEKLKAVLTAGITPILCIGETEQEYNEKITFQVLQTQLAIALQNLDLKNPLSLIIAYEPIWSIGTGNIPSSDHLLLVYDHITSLLSHQTNLNYIVLYGGSVDDKTIATLKDIPGFQGFLIGKASTDFQVLKKIVLSIENKKL